MAGEKFEKLRRCTWTAKGKAPIVIPIIRLVEDYENGLVKRRRPYRSGAKLDNLAREAMVWTIESIISDDLDEEGVPDDAYPAVADALCESALVEETGTLDLPTRGPVRAQIKSYKRSEDGETRDAAAFQVTFWEDNEDSQTAASFQAPQARSVAMSAADTCLEACIVEGVWSSDLSSLAEAAASLEAMANAPLSYANDLNAQAEAVVGHVARVQAAFADTAGAATSDASTLLLHPEAFHASLLLRRLGDIAVRAKTVPSGERETRSRVFPRDMSIFAISAELGQPVDDLLRLNTQIPNALLIPSGLAVRVYV